MPEQAALECFIESDQDRVRTVHTCVTQAISNGVFLGKKCVTRVPSSKTDFSVIVHNFPSHSIPCRHSSVPHTTSANPSTRLPQMYFGENRDRPPAFPSFPFRRNSLEFTRYVVAFSLVTAIEANYSKAQSRTSHRELVKMQKLRLKWSTRGTRGGFLILFAFEPK